MNAKWIVSTFGMLIVLLSACAPAATPTLAPQATQAMAAESQKAPAAPAQTRQERLPATMAPQATSAPLRGVEKPASGAAPVQTYPLQPQPAPQGNFFQDYGVNSFVDTAEDHLSTFGLDVDTASYTVARRYVEDGNLPPYDAVRAEEFINYFDQGYANPHDVAFGLFADGSQAPFDMGGPLVLRFGVQGYDIPDSQRAPAALTFVIDVSGSMNMENRLGLVIRSLELLVERLHPEDSVAIVVFGTSARTVLEPVSGAQTGLILDAIHSLHTEGSTNADAGLQMGYEMAMRAFKPNGTNRVIFCSDGVANTGATRPEEILDRIHGYVSEGVYLTSIGFGMGNFNDTLMEQMADKGNGFYAYVDDIEAARRLFIDKITGTLQTIAKDAKVQVDFNPEVVASYRLVGYENRAVADQDFRNDRVDAGEIGAGMSATAVYVVNLRSQAEGRISTVQLRWQDPKTGDVREINGNLNTFDLVQNFAEADPYFQRTVVAAQYAEILRQSPYARTTLNDLSKFAQWVAGRLPGDTDTAEFARLVERAAQIQRGY